MEEKRVSLWIGTFDSYDRMKDYFKNEYTEDGDRIESQFEDNFEIEDIDEDLYEVQFYPDQLIAIKNLIEGCSYEEQVIPKLYEKINNADKIYGNTVALLYDYMYNNEIKLREGEGYSISYIGTVRYNEV
ncbi:immunity 22 family protein [Vallitalea guaymasensis]|uniref:immunity 22 family protein n=1 Tax=Vallitalea guaymasensis TaxID=1185412 RepID=UPI00272C717D|nr:immunity 22 family protein [Vallitalea guaymasensis]